MVLITTCSWPRRPWGRGGHDGALPVDGRAGVAARVVADTHVTLVQLHCDVVIVPIVQQDPVVLCRGDLRGEGTFSPTPPHTAVAQVGGADEGPTSARGMLCAERSSPDYPRGHILQGMLTEASSRWLKCHPLPDWLGLQRAGRRTS